jgi:lipoate-protein ligase A
MATVLAERLHHMLIDVLGEPDEPGGLSQPRRARRPAPAPLSAAAGP